MVSQRSKPRVNARQGGERDSVRLTLGQCDEVDVAGAWAKIPQGDGPDQVQALDQIANLGVNQLQVGTDDIFDKGMKRHCTAISHARRLPPIVRRPATTPPLCRVFLMRAGKKERALLRPPAAAFSTQTGRDAIRSR